MLLDPESTAVKLIDQQTGKEKEKSRLLKRKKKGRLQCCFTSTETIRTVRDGEPRTSTSSFTQLLSSVKGRLPFLYSASIRVIEFSQWLYNYFHKHKW